MTWPYILGIAWFAFILVAIGMGAGWHMHRRDFTDTEPDAPNADVRSLDAQRALHPRRPELGHEEGA